MRTLLLFSSLLLCGCVSTADCTSDWHATGQRDGRLGAYQADLYASRCAGGVDTARYNQGWQEGSAQRPRISSF
jgi:hypothetical protein